MLTVLQKARFHRFLVVELNAIESKSQSYRNVSQEDIDKLNKVYSDFLVRIRLGMDIPVHAVHDLESLIESILRSDKYVARILREILRIEREANLIPSTYLKLVSNPQDRVDENFFKIENAFMLRLDSYMPLQEEAHFVNDMLPYIEGNIKDDDFTLIKKAVSYILVK